MEFRVLGTVEVVGSSGAVVPLGGPRVRTLLAALLLRANQPVSMDVLVDALWDGSPPRTAISTVHAYVSRIRARLSAAGRDGADRIITDVHSYRFRVERGELDSDVFEEYVEAARSARAAGRLHEAAERFGAALRMWRGYALAEITGAFAQLHVTSLNEKRGAVIEERLAVEIECGRHVQAIPELRLMVRNHPLSERLTCLLMLALYRSGRSAEALRAFQDIRRYSVDELGLEPGPQAQLLHQQILGNTVDPVPVARKPVVGNRNLPPDVVGFTGREKEIRALIAGADRDSPAALPVHAITGLAGVGKTALAVHTAHLLADRYPDGQLFLDMGAHTADQPPMTTGVALETLLLMIGVPEAAIPSSVELRAAVWRTQLADRRVVLVLDDVVAHTQVLPLLPGNRDCVVLVTSRSRLVGLPVTGSLPLMPLAVDDAARMFTTIVGNSRPAPEPLQTKETAFLCSGVPLAIRDAATLLLHRPGWTVADLNRSLPGHILVPEPESGKMTMGRALTESFSRLDHRLYQVIEVLSTQPGARFDVDLAADWTNLPRPEAQALLEALVDRNLLESLCRDTYQLNPLVRSYACLRGDLTQRRAVGHGGTEVG